MKNSDLISPSEEKKSSKKGIRKTVRKGFDSIIKKSSTIIGNIRSRKNVKKTTEDQLYTSLTKEQKLNIKKLQKHLPKDKEHYTQEKQEMIFKLFMNDFSKTIKQSLKDSAFEAKYKEILRSLSSLYVVKFSLQKKNETDKSLDGFKINDLKLGNKQIDFLQKPSGKLHFTIDLIESADTVSLVSSTGASCPFQLSKGSKDAKNFFLDLSTTLHGSVQFSLVVTVKGVDKKYPDILQGSEHVQLTPDFLSKVFHEHIIVKKEFPPVKSWFPGDSHFLDIEKGNVKQDIDTFVRLFSNYSSRSLSLSDAFSEKKSLQKAFHKNHLYHKELQKEEGALQNFVADESVGEDYLLRNLMKIIDYNDAYYPLKSLVETSFQKVQKTPILSTVLDFYFYYHQLKKIITKLSALKQETSNYSKIWEQKTYLPWKEKLQVPDVSGISFVLPNEVIKEELSIVTALGERKISVGEIIAMLDMLK